MPAPASAEETAAAMSSRLIWMGERLTLIASGSGAPTRASQSASVRIAFSSAQRPSWTISPDSSATGMNSDGEIGASPFMAASGPAPRSPRSRPVDSSISGWKASVSSSASIAQRSSVSMLNRRRAACAWVGS